ncbi:MAG: tetratricopeptide repeat protein [candidate division WOR-3 bacterium]
MITFLILLSLFIKENPSFIDSTLNYLLNEDYKEVRERIKILKEKVDEKDPLPFLLRTIYLYYFTEDYAVYDSEKVFLKEIEKLIEVSEKHNEDILWGKFCKATALAFKAMWLSEKEDYLNALNFGLESVNLFTECIEKNFFLKDSYLALGIYNYGAHIIQKYVGKKILKGERKEKGIEQIEMSYKEGKFIKPLSASVLIYVYIKERQKDKALKLAEKLYKDFPDSRILLWQVGRAYAANGEWKKAKEVFSKLYEDIEKNQKKSYYQRASIRYWLAKTNYLLGEKEIAKKYIKEALSFIKKTKWHEKKYLEKRINYYKKILEKS